ncbi:NAD(P)-dependent glycerol-3-phosphate dehydrogenase [Komagataeibacter sp. AV436]|uniref:Glycerol-3-phosphate dehydrogenase [NAD(P)+] n=1 Tax=Komagataeibacter melomenusus TaxID=2766578 RepID=A0ABX2AHX0_9PROT|nr:NAD(P)H-dependent glycerol-3-phosphate dehydrogenase [Komagataeibacter melomenusus]MBV1831742.1 NAD(P)-dependent glycerol-3-phosphate dehydrogenase [Komagataeibacter melomenusus]NPC67449.1 NAD(P)-dependent glycerol-3-phosphate dehydrogenase [Komagataeibacter melomenusus]
MTHTKRIAVIGAGAWGTALALQAARAGAHVTLWARNPAALSAGRVMPRLPGFALPEAITVTDALPRQADLMLLACPMQHLRAVGSTLLPCAPMIACCKGIEQATGLMPLQVLGEVFPHSVLGVLSGPNFAHEIAAGLPAAAVLASSDRAQARRLADLLTTPAFRLYASDDPTGVQLGGAAKNVVAIAAGATMGAKLGENARAGLITRAIAELARLSHALGGKVETLSGLAGIGDLLLTCTGAASRNYRLGLAVGQGMPAREAAAALEGVAEGMATAPALHLLAQAHGVSTPVIATVASLLAGEIDMTLAARALLARPVGHEFA